LAARTNQSSCALAGDVSATVVSVAALVVVDSIVVSLGTDDPPVGSDDPDVHAAATNASAITIAMFLM
jgi:hypothetical protein